MQVPHGHTFHIPVLGLAFSADTPIRVARFGISSVISIVDDVLLERLRRTYAEAYGHPYTPIAPKEHDPRARRITAYLNLVQRIVKDQIAELREACFDAGGELRKYFEMLPEESHLKHLYRRMLATPGREERAALEHQLRGAVTPGAIDVNIMTKLDKTNSVPGKGPLPPEFSDALSALRGFVQSDLDSSVVLSAGYNPRLFAYMEKTGAFLPDAEGRMRKKVILKVSDFRSGFVQGKLLAKKGIWVSEFRIESGLNCGGHAFVSDGVLLGPILEEFKTRRESLCGELHEIWVNALRGKGIEPPPALPGFRVTVQGGIGTAEEDAFLREHYGVDGTGWGSPFLLVPEATNVDMETRRKLADAGRGDFYLSDASPLGVPFNNLRGSSSELLARRRVEEGKPGSPCTKKYLVSNTEFTDEPICTASRKYQALKIEQLGGMGLGPDELAERVGRVVLKACLCEDLAASPFVGGEEEEEPLAVAVCPGPNLAYFSKLASLEEMVGHIYGRIDLLTDPDRPHMFLNELRLSVDYLREDLSKKVAAMSAAEEKRVAEFRRNIQEGIEYYRALMPRLKAKTGQCREAMLGQLEELAAEIEALLVPAAVPARG
jgi:hypothetical protein